MKKLGLEVVSNRGAHKDLIVFVHGLGGHRTRTWGNFPKLISQDDALKDYDMGFYGYPTSVVDKGLLLLPLIPLNKILPLFRQYDFSQKALEFAEELREALRRQQYQTVTFVGHSLGGLMVLAALKHLRVVGDPDGLKVLTRTACLLFYGTPLLSSDRVELLASLWSSDLRFLRWSPRFREDLVAWVGRSLQGHLLELGHNDAGRGIYADIGIFYGVRDRWVDVESAKGIFPEALTEQADLSHSQLCKPKDTSSRPYTFFRRNLLEAVARWSNSPSVPKVRQESAQDFQLVEDQNDPALPEIEALYENNFVINEQVNWKALVRDIGKKNGVVQHILKLTVGGNLCAMAVVQYHCKHSLAWAGYLAAEKDRPRSGWRLARLAALHIRAQHPECKGIFFEVERPDLSYLATPLRQERETRVKYFQRSPFVYTLEGVNYRLPAMNPDAKVETPMILMYVPLPFCSGLRYLAKAQVTPMLRCIVDVQARASRDHKDIDTYHTYLRDWARSLEKDLPLTIKVGQTRV